MLRTTGPVGGAVGTGSAGGDNGTIYLETQNGGITLNGNVSANGADGGAAAARAGDGGSGDTGLKGGAVAAAGSGGMGGKITIKAPNGALTIKKATVLANGGNGGDRSGTADNGGSSKEKGGAGGDVHREGFGGGAGKITIDADTKPPDLDPKPVAGARGHQMGTAGTGGAGKPPGNDGTRVIGSPTEQTTGGVLGG
jgi:hypothetical protein